MSRTLLLAPHSDDEVLFCSWTILREHPDVVVCLQDPDPAEAFQRSLETEQALDVLQHRGNLIFWPFREQDVAQKKLREELQALREEYEWCYAPRPYHSGHAEHNAVGFAAKIVFGGNVTFYETYTRSGGRSHGFEVEYEPVWISKKLRALACYVSQHQHAQRRSWFVDLLDLREWYA